MDGKQIKFDSIPCHCERSEAISNFENRDCHDLRSRNDSGFSLPELLVAIGILAIMAVGIFAITSYTQTHGKITTTETTIAIIDIALEQYYDFYDKFPNLNKPNESQPLPIPNPNTDTEFLYYKLTLCPEAKKTIGNIDMAMLKDDDDDGYPEIIDSWNRELKYIYNDNYNFPLVKSFGPDDANDTDDDITNR